MSKTIPAIFSVKRFCSTITFFFVFSFRTDPKEYALKQIEGAGLSMSACREIAVSFIKKISFSIDSLKYFAIFSASAWTQTPECH